MKPHASASLRDLRVGGLRRDEVTFQGGVVLKETKTSLLAWDRLRVEVASGEARAAIKADPRDDGETILDVTAEAPTSESDRSRRARGSLAARWGRTGVEVRQLGLILTGGGRPDAPVFAARGRYDREAGTLVLEPVAADRGPGTLSLAPEGVRVSGIGRAGALRATGALVGDLAALRGMGLLGGSGWDGPWSARAALERTGDGLRVGGRFDLADLSRPDPDGAGRRSEGPVAVSFNALYRDDACRLDLAELAATTRYATLEASGSVADPGGRREADLKGTLTPDWRAINGWLADRVEPGARAAGRPRAWHVRGLLAGGTVSEVLKGLDGEIGLDLTGADIYGLHVGPAPIVLRARDGKLAFVPIDATLNEGRVHLEPSLTLGDDEHGPALRLGPESTIADARINDEVSRRVLSFVAPVLDNATRVNGRVSVDLDEAVVPLGGDSRRGTTVDGEVVFQDVAFAPGPLADQLLGLIGRDDRPSLKLNQPVSLTIADRKVYQRGLSLPLGGISRVDLEGWVDFDRNLALTATLPVTRAMVGNRPVLGDIVEGTAIRVPIRGTLRKPEIDREAMNLAMKDLGKTLLERGIGRGAAELLDATGPGPRPERAPPADPRAAPRPPAGEAGAAPPQPRAHSLTLRIGWAIIVRSYAVGSVLITSAQGREFWARL